jgi:large subunit ribosomal protein L24
MAQKVEIKKGDLVEVIAGGGPKGQTIVGKRGKVLVVLPKENKIVLENIVMVKRHTKPRSAQKTGGIIEKPRPVDISNVMVVCPECEKKTRVGHMLGEDGKKYVRQCKKCGAALDVKESKIAKKTAKAKVKDAEVKESKTAAKKTEAGERAKKTTAAKKPAENKVETADKK